MNRTAAVVGLMALSWWGAASAEQPQSGPAQAEQPRSGPVQAEQPQSGPVQGANWTTAAPPIVKSEPRYAERAEVGLEFSPGFDLPLKRYLDFGSGLDRYFMDNSAGFGFGLALTLNRMELRWGYSRLGAGRVQGRIPPEITQLVSAYLNRTLPSEISLQADGPLIIHSVTLGYRPAVPLWRGLTLAVPLGIGLVIAEPPNFGLMRYSLFGIGANVGPLLEYAVARLVSVGTSVRFSAYVTEPDPNLAGAGLLATNKIYNNALAWLPLLSFEVHGRIHY